ncbi:MAG: GH3 auxin-responsive promoter family protein [Prevotella sp.]|uniref:GH3 auxin-responsive promoter family protein n=1 Tax=Prevotella sp. TaxID=59823 RepID=UPI002A24FFE5|nr:GH3 auxin-responsive promoter family protein [Prevotella sp.]MDD7317351.1 GH3 auxin-responsive promoter family protein [Prevotellaceae bacterium]MDY4019449.1 GH3 auxin-responsive promoter family protein [Prevotella sp.]
MSLTGIIRNAFIPRQKKLLLHDSAPLQLQREALEHLVERAKHTEYGQKHSFNSIKNYEDFSKMVPLNTYEELKHDINRMRHGEQDILWQGQVKWFAKSSGTTNDKSKFIPVSHEGLHAMHYKGGSDAVAMYLANNTKSRMFDGRALILGGSHSPNYNLPGSLVGDLSAILIENINPLANLVRVPCKKTALLSDFELKRDRIARETVGKNITNISGVPSWMLSVLMRVMELSGKQHLNEVWQNLEVFFHGGVAFTPYRRQYEQLIDNPDMHYMETYNASEGFFGLQNDPTDASMLLMLDYGVFYEFIPMDKFDDAISTAGVAQQLIEPERQASIVPLEGVKTGVNYAMLISTTCGLWRYVIGDTVRFTSVAPYKFVITGRTKHFINAFGEELIVDNAEQGLAYACRETGAEVHEYTAAPVFMDNDAKCRHQWLIEFVHRPDSLERFAGLLDKKLQEINSDYEAKRYKDITLQHPEVICARKGLFEDWMKLRGKLGGQNKVPRLSNSRTHIEQLVAMNGSE